MGIQIVSLTWQSYNILEYGIIKDNFDVSKLNYLPLNKVLWVSILDIEENTCKFVTIRIRIHTLQMCKSSKKISSIISLKSKFSEARTSFLGENILD